MIADQKDFITPHITDARTLIWDKANNRASATAYKSQLRLGTVKKVSDKPKP